MVKVYDIEVLSNFFLYYDLDVKTQEKNSFEVSVFKNQLPELLEYLKTVKGQIGFNNLNYDSQVIQHILKHYEDWRGFSGEEIAKAIHEYSGHVINKQDSNEWNDYRESDLYIPQLDLFKIHHYDNKARTTSLKWLQFSMDWHNLEDMPINHWDYITDRKVADSIIHYCENDVLSTYEFYKLTKGETNHPIYKGVDKIQLRKDIEKEFGFRCINYSDVKIGDEINKSNYLKSTGKKWYDIKNLRAPSNKFTFGDCIPEYVKFKTDELNEFYNRLKNIYIEPQTEQKFKVKFKDTTYCIMKGGIHSEDKARLIKPRKDQILRDADIGSQYPWSIIKRKLYPRHLGEAWLEGYIKTTNKRLEAKKIFKETKDPKYQALTEALKYSANGGGFGKTGEPGNWQYDPFISMSVTIGNQFEILLLIEMLELEGISVISANTDGILCLFNKDKEEKYYQICKEWEVIVGNDKIINGTPMGALEYTDFELMAQLSVNGYICLKTDGEVKEKKDFLTDFEMHKNKSYRIINLALRAYFIQGINPRKFITEHDNIFDFCAGVRTKQGWRLEARGIRKGNYIVEKLSKTNRYFISKNGFKLVKCHEDGREIQPDAGEWMATIYNKHEERPMEEYGINYDFYVRNTYKIINEIQPEVINEHFTQLSIF